MRHRGESLRAVPRLAVTAAAEETAGNICRVNELEGFVHCPVPGCTSTHFADFAVARHCEEPEVESYLEGRRLLAVARAEASVFDQAQGVLRAAGAELERLKLGGAELEGRLRGVTAREEARRRLAAQLATLFPNARQCGGCGFGPVDRVACTDLSALHGLEYLGADGTSADDWTHLQGMLAPINNACPRCQWFSPTAEAWPPWDGEVPTVRAPTFTVRTGDDPAAVRNAARVAAVAARVAAAADSDCCVERIYAIFFGDEDIPDAGLTYGEIVSRLLEFGFDEVDVGEGLGVLIGENDGHLEEYEEDAGVTFYTPRDATLSWE